MQKYIKDYLNSRNLDPDFDTVICEMCWHLKNRQSQAVDVHHILHSFRGKRKHSEDGSDLIGLCRECHLEVHSNNNSLTKDKLLNLVKTILWHDW